MDPQLFEADLQAKPAVLRDLAASLERGDPWADLGEVNRGGRQSGSKADGHEEGGRRKPVAHAEGAIDELGAESGECDEEERSHALSLSV